MHCFRHHQATLHISLFQSVTEELLSKVAVIAHCSHLPPLWQQDDSRCPRYLVLTSRPSLLVDKMGRHLRRVALLIN